MGQKTRQNLVCNGLRGFKGLEPSLDRADLQLRGRADVLRLGLDVLERAEVPHVAGPVDQVLRLRVPRGARGREVRVVAEVLPDISAAINE